ncbi:methyltransferase family protein [Bryobacter aggregatus]|uniref:methyltransferase family protein n=1 Tax=Bryobacter aggregatus TaxID=360054 RepID=UPI0004E17CC5|nr:isoprenylcysteine carboxylmethyltransferase family protein [Bryobacter aggregatus]
MLFLRALLAFVALPVVVSVLVPWLLLPNDRWRGAGFSWAWPLLVLGLCLLLASVRDFYVAGRGTLAPWDPPRKLVIAGLYRWVRNPMYLGVLAWVGGWSLLVASPLLAVYTALLAIGFHLRVLLYEEPTLARLFPADWALYRAKVNRWWPRLFPAVD